MTPATDIPGRIGTLIAAEVAAFDTTARPGACTLADFQRLRVPQHRAVTVNFSGGITQTCWTVTRSNGCYSVIYLPTADYFSLCVDSDFGPLDIGVHGRAIDCFSSV